jgi:ABC transport system ATP-binding/permease protein
MPLLTLADAELAHGTHPLLDRAALTVNENERIGLIGRNGTGKSSLLAVIAGTAALDDGELRKQDGLRTALVGKMSAPDHHRHGALAMQDDQTRSEESRR